jgi:nifR3 family TIM-barrel protein
MRPSIPRPAIGGIVLDSPFILAPLAGYTDLPFRLIAKKLGAALVVTEMASSHGLVRGPAGARRILLSSPEDRPFTAQIFGGDPVLMGMAARVAQDCGADAVDVNCGCSVKKILKTGAGAELMRDPLKAARVFEAVRKAVTVPFTVKMRSGWRPGGVDALEIARIAVENGADAVALHPRTARQGFSGEADWTLIQRLREALPAAVPVIGNGDVTSPERAVQMLEETGCQMVMIGRAAISNPWIFAQAKDVLEGRAPRKVPVGERFDLMLDYIQGTAERLGEERARHVLRSRLAWFSKGLPGAFQYRESVKLLASSAEAIDKTRAYRDRLMMPAEERAGDVE